MPAVRGTIRQYATVSGSDRGYRLTFLNVPGVLSRQRLLPPAAFFFRTLPHEVMESQYDVAFPPLLCPKLSRARVLRLCFFQPLIYGYSVPTTAFQDTCFCDPFQRRDHSALIGIKARPAHPIVVGLENARPRPTCGEFHPPPF